ncbi:hypothetical protein AVEN_161154-1, partial [Araneus ventricosus]
MNWTSLLVTRRKSSRCPNGLLCMRLVAQTTKQSNAALPVGLPRPEVKSSSQEEISSRG